MISIQQFKELFQKAKGKTIAIVYIFEGDNSSGFEHFFIWKSNVLAKWMNAVEELHCLPLIIDVRTFVDKAMNKTLPYIDYVLNMNSGTYNLSSMALVPSTCSSIGVPCIPCSAVSIVTGESKSLSNLIARSIGINVPETLDRDNENGIFRPINMGNSVGVKRGASQEYKDGLYQEFIPGYDITTPIVYNAITQTMELLPTVLFLPKSNDTNWFLGEKEKTAHEGFEMRIVYLEDELRGKYLELISALSLQTFCRIDARVKCTEGSAYHDSKNSKISFSDAYFVEINVMPTIRDNNSFLFSFDSIDSNSPFYPCIETQKQMVGGINLNSFLLASSMMSFIKTKC